MIIQRPQTIVLSEVRPFILMWENRVTNQYASAIIYFKSREEAEVKAIQRANEIPELFGFEFIGVAEIQLEEAATLGLWAKERVRGL